MHTINASSIWVPLGILPILLRIHPEKLKPQFHLLYNGDKNVVQNMAPSCYGTEALTLSHENAVLSTHHGGDVC